MILGHPSLKLLESGEIRGKEASYFVPTSNFFLTYTSKSTIGVNLASCLRLRLEQYRCMPNMHETSDFIACQVVIACPQDCCAILIYITVSNLLRCYLRRFEVFVIKKSRSPLRKGNAKIILARRHYLYILSPSFVPTSNPF